MKAVLRGMDSKNSDKDAMQLMEADWDTLAAQQKHMTLASLKTMKHLEVLALEERIAAGVNNWRRILVRVDEPAGEVHVFDRRGVVIHEPSKRIEHGKKRLDFFLADIELKGNEQMYRLPCLRRAPVDRGNKSMSHASGSSIEPTLANSDHTAAATIDQPASPSCAAEELVLPSVDDWTNIVDAVCGDLEAMVQASHAVRRDLRPPHNPHHHNSSHRHMWTYE